LKPTSSQNLQSANRQQPTLFIFALKYQMETAKRHTVLKQILWDYNISAEDIEAVLRGDIKQAGHYNQEMIFLKILESYSWYTVLDLFSPIQIKELLTNQVIKKLRSPSLRLKYEFVQQRLQQIIPTAG
jgi:hypothetical protein